MTSDADSDGPNDSEQTKPATVDLPPAPTPWPRTGRYKVRQPMPPPRPPSPLFPYLSPPKGRKRHGDRHILVIALLVVTIIFTGCCLAGYALKFH